GDSGRNVNLQALCGGTTRVAVGRSRIPGCGNDCLTLGLTLLDQPLNLSCKRLPDPRLAESIAGADERGDIALDRLIKGIPHVITASARARISRTQAGDDEDDTRLRGHSPRPLQIKLRLALVASTSGRSRS